MENDITTGRRQPWNKNKLIGQKPPLKLKEIWAIRVRLQLGKRTRDLAMFNLAIDSKLRGCDLVSLRVRDITHGNQVAPRAIIMQQKTKRPVQFELTEPTRDAVAAWLAKSKLKPEQFLFPSRLRASPHMSTRQYARVVHCWVASIGLDPTAYGTHTMRRTKAVIFRRRMHEISEVDRTVFSDVADASENGKLSSLIPHSPRFLTVRGNFTMAIAIAQPLQNAARLYRSRARTLFAQIN